MTDPYVYEREEHEYYDAGIQIQRDDGVNPEFYYQGRRISKSRAEEIARFFNAHGRRPAEGEFLPGQG